MCGCLKVEFVKVGIDWNSKDTGVRGVSTKDLLSSCRRLRIFVWARVVSRSPSSPAREEGDGAAARNGCAAA